MRQVTEAWLGDAAEGSVLVDLSTNAPRVVRELGERVAVGGCHLLEAPLTGGAPGAQTRMLVFLVGGEKPIYERCLPLLDKLGRAVFYFGELGLGNTAKLVNSLLAFTCTWVSLEGLAIAAKTGIDLRTMVEAVRTGGASNFYMDRMVEGIHQRGRPAQFALELAAKDALLIAEAARGARRGHVRAQEKLRSETPQGCRLKAPPGEADTAARRRLGRDPRVRTLSATGEVAALPTSRWCFTEVSHEAHKPGIGMCLAGAAPRLSNLGVLAFSAFVVLGTASSACAEAVFMGLGDLPGGSSAAPPGALSANGSTVVGQRRRDSCVAIGLAARSTHIASA